MQQKSTAAALPSAITLALLAVLLGGCTQPVELTSEYGPGVQFSDTAHSYSWTPTASRTTGEGRPENPSVDKMIREFLELHLARKGYVKVTASGTPDFLVDYTVAKSLRADPNDFTKPMHTEGTLEVTAISPGTSKLIWRGSAQTKVDSSTPPETARQRLDLVIGQLIGQIPSSKVK